MDKTNALSLRGDGTFRNGPTLTYLIDDEFTDTRSAGSVNGTAATPGPGTRTVTDTESKLSVGSGVLAFAGGKASPASGDPGLWYGAQTRAAGLGVVARVTTGAFSGLCRLIMLDSNTTGTGVHDLQINGATEMRIAAGSSNVVVGAIALSTTYQTAICCRSGGAFYFVKGGAFSDWTLIWVDNAEISATLYPGATTYNGAFSLDHVRVTSLPTPFDADDGLATDTHSGSVAAGTTFTHEADCLIEFTVDTVPSANSIDVYFRTQDANNAWIARLTDNGSFVLVERTSGSGVTRASAGAGTISSGHRIVVIADGTTIKGYSNNTLRWTYSSATNFATATAGEVDALGTGGVISDVKTWPRTLSGTAASILNRASA